MAFRGLFIGIDRYQSPQIHWLSCAKRDAIALDALFFDTLGGSTTLLVDEVATRARIEREFESLARCDPGDTVVIAFSGHGTDTHELVAYDTDVRNLSGTSVRLSTLAEWFARIPARRLVLVLDCCFSGGMGAKVLRAEAIPRDMKSVDAELTELSGDGRLIITASAATEPAWEDPRSGHGYLTHFLIEALRGGEEIAELGRISVYSLLEYVTRGVTDRAHQFCHPQHPTMRGTIDGELSWPTFAPGERYRAAFPEYAQARATSALESLSDFGFPPVLIAAWQGPIPSLNRLQLDAVNEFGVLAGGHLVVAAPTSSGKTMVGELAALKSVLGRKRAVFLFPLKALVADKRRHFETVYGPFGLRVIEATGETDDIGPLLRGQYDVALLTYEKFSAVALTYPHVIEQLALVVVDEVQMLANESRGANLEFLLTLILMRRREGIEPQLIALSGVIGEINGFERWLGARLLRRDERPVPLDEGLLLASGVHRYLDAETGLETVSSPLIRPFDSGKNSSQDLVIPLVQKLVAEGQQVIVFRETKGETRGCARYLAKALALPHAGDALEKLPGGDLSLASQDLKLVLQSGVSFHNADLAPLERSVIEDEFRRPDATLRVIVATTTLAMGVNTPASSVVIVGLDHSGDAPYSVAEYKNLVGRAGRLGYSARGTSYLIALDGLTEHTLWTSYVAAKPEDLTSRFLDADTDPRSLVLRVLVAGSRTGKGMTREQIAEFLEASFGAFQKILQLGSWKWSHEDLLAAIQDLAHHKLIVAPADGLFELTPLGRLAGESGSEVESIIRLVDCLGPLTVEQITDPALLAAVQTTCELSDVTFPINKKSTQKEPQTWLGELRSQGVPSHILGCLGRNASFSYEQALRAKKAVACLLYVSGREMSEIERILTQFGAAIDGAAGPVRGIADRTSDLLQTAARVAELLHADLNLQDRLGRLVVRLTYGVPPLAVELARVAGKGLQRGDYLRLVAAQLITADRIARASDAEIMACVDGSTTRLVSVRRAAEVLASHQADPQAVAPDIRPYES